MLTKDNTKKEIKRIHILLLNMNRGIINTNISSRIQQLVFNIITYD